LIFAETIYEYARLHVYLFWSVIGLSVLVAIYGLLFWPQEGRSFALMTAIWVVINASIGYWLIKHIHVPAESYLSYTFAHTRYWMRVNVLLDLSYGVVGIYLWYRSQHLFRHRRMIRAFAKAVVFQAVCLLVIDLIFLGRLYSLFQRFVE